MKRYSIATGFLLVAWLLFTAGQCSTESVREGMARFDRAFLPVLVYTYQGDLVRAKAQLINLEFQWQRFYDQYGATVADNEDWTETFRRVNDWLGDVYRTIDYNDRELALVQLGHIRYEWMSLREQEDIPYALDAWYEFDITVCVAVETAADPQLCLLEWYEFEELIADVWSAWHNIQSAKTDAELFELSTAELARLQGVKGKMIDALFELNERMECADHQEVAEAGQRLQPIIMEAYTIYGNWDESLYHYATNGK